MDDGFFADWGLGGALGAQAQEQSALRDGLIAATPDALDGWLAQAPPMLALVVLLLGLFLAAMVVIAVFSVAFRLNALAAMERTAEAGGATAPGGGLAAALAGGGAMRAVGARPTDAWIEIERARKLAGQGDLVGARISAETAVGVAKGEREQLAASSELAMALAAAGEAKAADAQIQATLAAARKRTVPPSGEGFGQETVDPEALAAAHGDLSGVEERAGDAQMALGAPEAAGASYAAAMDSLERAVGEAAAGPAIDARRIRLALKRAEADPAQASAQRARAAALAEGLVARAETAPVSPDALGAAAEAFEAEGGAALDADSAAGRARLEQALAIRRRLVETAPRDRAAARPLVRLLARLEAAFPGEGFAREGLKAAESASLGPTETAGLTA